MKSGIFVEGLSNVSRFLDGTRAVANRGAREASWLLVEGMPGLGKTGTLTWYGLKQNAAFIRAKAGWTPHWLLTDLADVLRVNSRIRSTEELFKAVMPELMIRANQDGLVLIVDEIDHAAKDAKVLETLRDLTDASELPLIAVGMKGAQPLLRRFPQISSRLADVVTFQPATVADVKLICAELSEVSIADDLAEEIQQRTGGLLREVKTAIGRIEHKFRRERGKITLAMWTATKATLTTRERAHV